MARGEYGTTTISPGSGALTVGHITPAASLQAGSGNLRIGAASGDLDVATGCGDIDIGSVTGAATVKSGSGDVEIGTAGTSLRVDPQRRHRCRVGRDGAAGDDRLG